MSDSGYDPFDYGLIKPKNDDRPPPVPEGDPEDMLFDTDSGEPKAAVPGYDPGPMGSCSVDLEPTPPRGDRREHLCDAPSASPQPKQADSFTPAPPPSFEEATSANKAKRPHQLSIGVGKPIAATPSPSPAAATPPPWLRDDRASSRRLPMQASQSKPVSRIALKVASPGVAHHRRSGGGGWLMPLIVLTAGLGGASYLYLILEKVILAGLVCAISLIGSMFCGVLLRSKP